MTKTIIQTMFPMTFGLGDMLAGVVGLYKLSREMDFNLEVYWRYHKFSDYINDTIAIPRMYINRDNVFHDSDENNVREFITALPDNCIMPIYINNSIDRIPMD